MNQTQPTREELTKQIGIVLTRELTVQEVAAYASGKKEAITEIMKHEIMQLIDTYTQAKVLEARIDEREQVSKSNAELADVDYKYPNIGFAAAITKANLERITTLQAEREKLK